jgi:hypothetical protein
VLLPETISVKYTEEEAGHLSVRPVVRQTFRAAELIDMIVQVTGKDSRRLQQVLRGGTVVFHSYRYWWQGFEPDAVALQDVLAMFPDADPARPFAPEHCSEIILESSGSPPRHSLRIKRAEAQKKRGMFSFFRSGDFWNALMNLGKGGSLHYNEYSYEFRADVYARALGREDVARLAGEANRHAPRELRLELRGVPSVSQIVFVCPRLDDEK